MHRMYGEKVQDILATTERLRQMGYYRGRLGAAFLSIGDMTGRTDCEEYALDDQSGRD